MSIWWFGDRWFEKVCIVFFWAWLAFIALFLFMMALTMAATIILKGRERGKKRKIR